MTKRERYLKALRNEAVDELVWAPNFDYWLHVSQAEGTLPPQYRDVTRNDIVRAIGATIWNRARGLKTVTEPSVRESWSAVGTQSVHEFHTPIGSIREVYSQAEGPHRSRALTEHFIKDVPSLKIRRYIVEATHCEADYEPTRQALRETGDDGIVLNSAFCVPFIQFAKTDAGYVNGFYLWTDEREAVDGLIGAWMKLFLEGYRILADGPADIVATGDNMDGFTISPPIFKEYAVPFYQQVRAMCHARGKCFEGHWCGRTQNLLPLVPSCGLDIVEAIVTTPMADITLAGALDLLQGQVVLQGGIPSVLVCPASGSTESFERYVDTVIRPLRGRKGFILGMSDNVPPNADFARIESIAQLIR